MHILSLICEVTIALCTLATVTANLNSESSQQGAGDVAFLVMSLLATLLSFCLNTVGARDAYDFVKRLCCGQHHNDVTLLAEQSHTDLSPSGIAGHSITPSLRHQHQAGTTAPTGGDCETQPPV